MAHGEQRIVALDRARADDDRVAKRAQTVQMNNVVGPRDVVRVAGPGRDPAVEALAEVRDRERPFARRRADRRVEIEQRAHRGGRAGPDAPAGRARDEPRL